eukprot:evm.model.scf_29.4 EVM.evm.TU.scf_29.4   scf_29:66003-69982(+)
MCTSLPGTEFGGDFLGEVLEVENVGKCCKACEAIARVSPSKVCNVYVYCPPDAEPGDCTPQRCVLKNSQEIPPEVISVNVYTSGINCLANTEGCRDLTPDDCDMDAPTQQSGGNSTSKLLVIPAEQCCPLCKRTPECKARDFDGPKSGCAKGNSTQQQPGGPLFFSGIANGPEGVPQEVLEDFLGAENPCIVEQGVDFPGNDIVVVTTADPQLCCRMCLGHLNDEGIPDCFAWTWNTKTSDCSLKNKISARMEDELLVGATAF